MSETGKNTKMRPLVIGVDIRELKVAKTGIKTYLEELYREFKEMDNNEVKFYFLDTSWPVYNGNAKLMKWVGHFRYQFWKQVVLPLKAWSKGCDIVFCVDNCVPYLHLGYKTVPSIHDAFCFESPENYGKLWLWSYKNTATPGARRSPLIVAATAYGKKQVAHYMQIPEDRFIVVHDGPKRVNFNPNDKPAQDILKKFNVEPKSYILHVGSMYKRKNIVALVTAFGKLKQQGYHNLKLVLAGSLSTNQYDNDHDLILNTIKEYHIENEVVITGYLSDAEIGQLYQNGLLYVFPSLNEGFGLPVLEAFEHNLPVLVSNNTCLPEVGGDAVISFDPYDYNDLAGKLKLVLNDEGLRKQMIEKGRERLQSFSWRKTATEIIEVFKKAAAL
jgi:glycosyltransferase involved in cell wall biosynthesis